MRLASLTCRTAAIGATSLLFLGLAPGTSLAATSLSCDTNPINSATATAAAFHGTDAPNTPEAVTATSSGTAPPPAATTAGPKAATADAQGRFSGTIDVSSLPDGIITMTARSATSSTCTATKDTVPPAAPSAPTVTPSPFVNRSQQTNVRVSTTAGNDANSVRLTIGDGTTTLAPVFPSPTGTTASGSTYTAFFDVSSLKEGVLTVTATTMDLAQNGASTTTQVTKDATPPTTPTVTAATGKTSTGFNTVSSSDPGPGQPVTISGGSSETSTFAVTVTDSVGGTLTVGPTASGTTYSVTFDPYALADGPLTVSVVATDTAGNPSPAGTKTLSKDTSVPQITGLRIAPSPIGSSGAGAVTVSGTVVKQSSSAAPSELGTAVAVALSGPAAVPPASPMTATVPIASDGTFHATFNGTSFPDGTVTADATPTDPAGNVGSKASTATNKDTVAPAKPALNSVTNDTGGATQTVTVRGTAEPGSTAFITVTDASGTQHGPFNATAGPSAPGAFSTTFDATSFPQGGYTATAVASDSAGNVSVVSDPRTAEKDTVALALLGTNPASGGTVSPMTPIGASFNEPLNPTSPSTNISVVNTATNAPVSGNTSFSGDGSTIFFTPSSPWATGSYRATVNVLEARPGGDSITNVKLPFTADATPPDAPTLGALTNPVNASNQAAIHATGTAEPGSTVTIVVTDSSANPPLTAAKTATGNGRTLANGTFNVVIDVSGLAENALSANGTATDAYGNTSGVSNTVTTTKDTVAPSVSGLHATDTTQGAPSSAVSGKVSEGADAVTVTLTDGHGGTTNRTAPAASDGTFTIPVDASALADGTDTASAVATDAAGNPSTAVTTSFVKDTTGPSVASLAGTVANGPSHGVTTVSGTTGEAGTSVTLTVTDVNGHALSATPTPNATTGSFSAPIDASTLADGALSITAVAKDSKSNVGPTAAASTRKDTVLPAVTGLSATATNASQSGSTVTGTTEPGATVVLAAALGGKTASTTTTTDGSGAFSAALDLTGFPDGAVPITATATDSDGNIGPGATTSASRDTALPTIASLAASATNASHPASIVTGTTEPGSAVSLSAAAGGRTATATATADSGGAFSGTLDLTGFPDGSIPVTATATDVDGNTGPAATTSATRDTGLPVVNGLAATATSTGTPQSTVTGTTEALATVALTATDSASKKITSTATAGSGGTFSTTLDLSTLADGTITIDAIATDTASNVGPKATTSTTKNTVGPSITGLAATATSTGTPVTTVSGTTTPNSTVALTATDSASKKITGTATAGSGGTFSTTLDMSTLADGTITIDAIATDTASNVGPKATTSTTKNTVGPSITGLAATATSTGTPVTTVSGTTTPNSTVALTATDSASKKITSTATAGSGGTFSTTLDLSTLADGTITIDAIATDTASNVGPKATTSTTKNTVGPSITGLAATATSTGTPVTTVSGTTTPNSTVALTATDSASKKITGTATAGSGGTFSTTLDLSTLADGTITIDAIATDTASNVGPKATTSTTKNTVGPSVTNLGATASTTAARATVVTGVTAAGATVAVRASDGTHSPVTGSTTAAGDGSFSKSLDLTPLSDGPITVTAVATDTSGNVGSPAATTTTRSTATPVDPALSTYTPVVPVRVLDTRPAPDTVGGPARRLGPGEFLDLTISGGPAQIPADATAVVLNVTAVAPTAVSDIRVYPTPTGSGAQAPGSSSLNLRPGVTEANLVVVKIGDAGRVRLYNHTGAVSLLADVAGYYRSGTGGAAFTSMSPIRLMDTRNGSTNVGPQNGPVLGTGVVDLQVTGANGVPASATAVVLNVTAVAPTSGTDVRVYPSPASGASFPTVSNLNVDRGITAANLVIVRVGDGGRVRLRNASGAVHLIVDLAGFFAPAGNGTAGSFVALPPSRVLDTRPGSGNVGPKSGPLAAGETLDLAVAGVAGVPINAKAIVLNVTATGANDASDVRVYPTSASGSAFPNVSNLNVLAGITVPNLVISQIGDNGEIRLRNSHSPVYLLADVAGYFS